MKFILFSFILFFTCGLIAQTEKDCESFLKGKFAYKDAIITKNKKKQVEKLDGKIFFEVINFGDCETYLIYKERNSSMSGDLNVGDTIYCKLVSVKQDTFITRMEYRNKKFEREFVKLK